MFKVRCKDHDTVSVALEVGGGQAQILRLILFGPHRNPTLCNTL